MSPRAILVSGVSKRFGRVTAVDDLSFAARPGRVTGFLGPNGAGKTTTLRILLGLVTPDAGTATIDGVPYRALPDPGRRVGALIDAAGFHPARSGRDHLRIHCSAIGIPQEQVEAVLSRVGLEDAAGRRIRGYSLGMRQRLGLATALLGDPPALVLDEPSNGLDPGGIAWLRDLLRGLAGEGRTVLVSSHLLAEAQRLVDDVVIVQGGRLVCEAPLDELTTGTTDLEGVFLGLTAGAAP